MGALTTASNAIAVETVDANWWVDNPARQPIADLTRELVDRLLLKRLSLVGIARVTLAWVTTARVTTARVTTARVTTARVTLARVTLARVTGVSQRRLQTYVHQKGTSKNSDLGSHGHGRIRVEAGSEVTRLNESRYPEAGEQTRRLVGVPQAKGQLTVEMDELWSFVGSKPQKQGVWLTIGRDTCAAVGCALGD